MWSYQWILLMWFYFFDSERLTINDIETYKRCKFWGNWYGKGVKILSIFYDNASEIGVTVDDNKALNKVIIQINAGMLWRMAPELRGQTFCLDKLFDNHL